VLATYNRAHLIGRAVDSVLAQSLDDWELVVVDDGSTDDTSDIIAAYRDRRIRYLRHDQNMGPGAARNRGIGAARGVFLAFLDSDDEWVPARLKKQHAVFLTTELANVAVVNCGVRERKGMRWSERRPGLRGDVFDHILAFGPGVVACTPSLMVRHTPGRPLALFDEKLRYGEDWEYLLKLTHTYQLDHCTDPLVILHDSAGDTRLTRTAQRTPVLHTILTTYEAELAANKYAHAKILLMLGKQQIAQGAPAVGRETLLTGIGVDPRRASLWWWLFGSFTTSLAMQIDRRRGLRMVWQLLRGPAYVKLGMRRICRKVTGLTSERKRRVRAAIARLRP
jgi:glycosyltransferase involved in cell wall biosynthesis